MENKGELSVANRPLYKTIRMTIIIIDNQEDATILIYLFLNSSTCFGRCFRPSSGAYHCNYSCSPMVLLAGVSVRNTSQQHHRWAISEAAVTVKCS